MSEMRETRTTPQIGDKVFVQVLSEGAEIRYRQAEAPHGGMFYTGEVVAFDGIRLVLDSAAWIAATGRFGQAMTTGKFLEVEALPDGRLVNVPWAATICHSWPHDLPRKTV